MGVELGVWEGSYQNQTQRWLRWWDNQGNLLLTGSEQARLECLHTEQERQQADRTCANPTGCYSPTAGNGFKCRASRCRWKMWRNWGKARSHPAY